MRKRPIILTAAVAVAGLAILGTVVAQQPPTKGPIGPAPATPVVRPPQDWTPTPPPPGYKPSQPPQSGAVRPNNGQVAPAVSFNQPVNNPAQGSTPVNRPRLGQAGVSTGEIKAVGAQEIPQPSMDVQPGGTNPKPIIEVEPQPDNKFPSAGATPPGGEIPPIGTPPIGIAPPIGTPPGSTIPPIGTPPSGAIPPIAAPPSGVVAPPVGGGATPPGVMPKFPSGTPGVPTTGAPIIPGVPGAPGAPSTPASPAAPIAPTIGSTPLPSKTTQNVTVEAVCPSEVVFGGDFTYELVVHNEGNVPVQGVRIEDEIPATTKYISSDPPAERSGDKLVWAIGAMEAHTDKRITVKVRPGEEGELHSRATVTYTGSVEARTRITRPRLTVNAACVEVCRVGEDAMFQVKITNSGTGPAEELMLRAEMSEGLFFPKEPKPKLETRLPTIPAGESQTIKLPLNAVKAGLNSCQFTVAAKGCSETGAKAQVNVVEPLLQIAHAGPAKCLVRSEPIYEITLNNPGTAPTEAITLYAQLPEGFDYVQCSDTGLFNATTRTISWKLQALAPNGSKTVALKIRSTVAGNVTLQTKAISLAEQPITAVAAGAKPMGRMLEAKGETAIRAEGVPAVRFEVKDVDDPVETGKEAIYEIRVTNQGTGACTNVQLMAALADGTTFSGASGPTNVKAQGQTLVFDPIKSLPVKGETVYTVRVKGNVIGDQRFRVQLTCDQVRTPVVKEESTSFYKQ